MHECPIYVIHLGNVYLLFAKDHQYIPSVHPVIDERIEHGISHSKPIKSKVDVLDHRHSDNLFVVVCVNEVDVIWEPTDGKDDNDHDEHFDNLKDHEDDE